jgi:hypothetical protein
VIIKLSASGKAVQVITDAFLNEKGEAVADVYQFPVYKMRSLLDNPVGNRVEVLTRLPLQVSGDRFPPSPVWTGDIMIPGEKVNPGRKADDAFAYKHRVAAKQNAPVMDAEIDWS